MWVFFFLLLFFVFCFFCCFFREVRTLRAIERVYEAEYGLMNGYGDLITVQTVSSHFGHSAACELEVGRICQSVLPYAIDR